MIGAGGAGRPGRRRQSAQAGAGPRRTAHDRGHDLGRIQEIFRERRGADPPLPGGQGRGADRGGGDRDDARPRRRRWKKHHKVRILDEAVVEAVRLSHRYISGRQLPDKAGQPARHRLRRVAMSQPRDAAGDRGPAAADRADRHRDRDSRARDGDRRRPSTRDRADADCERARRRPPAELERRCEAALGATRKRLAAPRSPRLARADRRPARSPPTSDAARERAGRCSSRAARAAGRAAADLPGGRQPGGGRGRRRLDRHPGWAGWSDEIRTVLQSASETMEERVIGQSQALDAVAQAIRPSRARLTDPRKPIGVFLMVGTQRRRQDRNRAGPGRPALWRRAEHDRHQHVGVQGGA